MSARSSRSTPRRSDASPPAADAELRALVIRAAREELHRRCDLDWLLDSNQRGIVAQLDASTGGRWVLECSRRLGKTHVLAWLALRELHRNPRARIVYCGPTLKAVQELLLPALEVLCADAPPEWRPRYDVQRGHIRFEAVPGHIHVFGCDDKAAADRGRGPSADLVLIDEAGFIRILGYAMRDVLRPQTLTTGARMVIASSPAAEPGHEFTRIAEAAERTGNYVHRTIHDNPRLTTERIAEFIAEDANDEGMTSEEYQQTDTFQREYLARRVVDRTLVGVPEWADVAPRLMVECEQPEYFDSYVSLDYGGADPHAALFGYLDFQRQVLVITHELLLREGENTAELAASIQGVEREAWGLSRWEGTLRGLLDEDEQQAVVVPGYEGRVPPQPYLRVADHDVQLTRDLQELHGVAFAPALKTDKQHAVNWLRVMLREGKVEVHPRCRHLDRHLRQTVWANEKRKEWRRTAGGEHGDLVDALLYLTRAVDWTRNPWPRLAVSRREEWRERQQQETRVRSLARALGRAR